jgi:hypothetical protein
MNRKIYYLDNNVKITDIEISCGDVVVPIDKIENIAVDFKLFTAAVAFTLLLLSVIVIPFLCHFHGNCGYFGIIFPLVALLWFWWACRTYVELKIFTNTGELKLLTASVGERKFIFRIEEIIKTALKENRKLSIWESIIKQLN